VNPVFALHGLTLVVTGIGAVTDYRTGHIPNWLTLPVIGLAPVAHLALGGGRALIASLLGLFVCGLVPYLLFRKGAMQGGDVKMFAAIGALVGLKLGIEAELLSFIVAAVLSLAALAWRGKLWRTLAGSFFLAANPVLPKSWRREVEPEAMSRFRLGISIFGGTCIALALRHPYLWR
jgi:prepilin peptidase CpaA